MAPGWSSPADTAGVEEDSDVVGGKQDSLSMAVPAAVVVPGYRILCPASWPFQFATSTAFILPTPWNGLSQYSMMFW